MKKYVIIIVIIIGLIILGFLSPWFNWNLSLSRIFGYGSKNTQAALQVYSLVGELEVYLDNEFRGSTTPEGGGLELDQITPGTHELRLKRKSTVADSYFELVRNIKFEEGVDVIASFELGPTREFSEGHIFYAQKNYNAASETNLNVISVPDNASLYIDNNLIGNTPVANTNINLNAQHTIKLVHPGYDTIEFKILPDNQDDRNKLKGYTLNLEVNMFLLPLKVN
jgi:hypothetical protein